MKKAIYGFVVVLVAVVMFVYNDQYKIGRENQASLVHTASTPGF